MENHCHILRLPNEILFLIFKYLNQHRRINGMRTYGTHRIVYLRRLPRVCKRFSVLVKPLLYQKLEICHKSYYIACTEGNPCARFSLELLHRTLNVDEVSRHYCQSLSIAVGKSQEFDLMVMDLARWLKGLAELIVNGEVWAVGGDGPWHKEIAGLSLIHAPSLRTIKLHHNWGPDINILGMFEPGMGFDTATSLQSLSMTGVSVEGELEDFATLEVGS